MFFRTPRFIRRFIRRVMDPVSEEKAHDVRQKLSYLYMFFAWNAAGYVGYQILNGNKFWAVTEGLISEEEHKLTQRPAYWYAKILNIPKAEVYRVRGISVAELPPVELEKEKEKDNQSQTQEDQQVKSN